VTATLVSHPTNCCSRASRGEIGVLAHQVRRLWQREPSVQPDEREPVLRQLIDIDVQLQRLGVRDRTTKLDSEGLSQLRDCSQRLDRLRRYWPADL
jgi:hypothetical protein